MKYLLILLISGCVTINKTYLPQAKKDTVYLPCNKIHVTYSDYPVWRSEPFMFSPGVLDTSVYKGEYPIKVNAWLVSSAGHNSIYTISDTLKTHYDTTVIYRGWPRTDSVRVLLPQKGG